MPELRTVVLVGHCGPDIYLLNSAVERALPGAKVVAVNDADALQHQLAHDPLLLVNRVLDGRFSADDGAELIEELARSEHRPQMILISNYQDAQSEAVAAGALPGFGKAQLHDSETAAKLRAAAYRP